MHDDPWGDRSLAYQVLEMQSLVVVGCQLIERS